MTVFAADRLRRRMLNPWLLRGFLLARLPLAWFAGLRVRRLDPEGCEVVVPRGWRTQNPFRFTYFAALSMAAELSTGALALVATEEAGAPVSMLVTEIHATFEKKATANAVFTCEDGQAISDAVRRAAETGEPVTVETNSIGRLPEGTLVARFVFQWSFKRKEARG